MCTTSFYATVGVAYKGTLQHLVNIIIMSMVPVPVSSMENVSRLTGIGADEPLGIPSESPARWIALGAAMAIQENGITSIGWFAMLRGWEMARSA
jgi:hypothetical protein